MRISLALILISFIATSIRGTLPVSTEQALEQFYKVLEKRNEYFDARNGRIDSIKNLLANAKSVHDSLSLIESMANEYAGVSVDSALHYYKTGERLAACNRLGNRHLHFKLHRISLQPFSGAVKESIDEMNSINPDSIPSSERKCYFAQRASMYYNILRFYPDGQFRDRHKTLAVESYDSLLNHIKSGTVEYDCIEAQLNMLKGNKTIAFATLSQTLPHLIDNHLITAKATALMAEYFEGNPQKQDEYTYYLAISATNDIMAGNREVSSLQRLGKEAWRQGESLAAYKIIAAAIDDAHHSGSRLNIIESAEMFPSVISVINDSENKYKTLLITTASALALTLITIGIFIVYLRLRKKAISENQTKEHQIRDTKRIYTAKLLDLCSFYMDKIEDFNTYVGRKLKTGQVQDLHSSIESKASLKKYADEFYAKFDETLLELYPDFIDNLNSELLPGRKLQMPDNSRLTPEMRIAVFMHLGITDSNMLSKFLGLSVNTVYTYRNRLKNRAADRANFEQKLQKNDWLP